MSTARTTTAAVLLLTCLIPIVIGFQSPHPARTSFVLQASKKNETTTTTSTLQTTLDPYQLQTTIDPTQPALIETIGGGSAMIFEMARRMLIWDEEETPKADILPRWHPHSGISDVNPSFRTKAPIMNNLGYAATIWRNVRKRNKPSLWRHALRTYDRMDVAATDSRTSILKIERSTVHHEGALVACSKLGLWEKALSIYSIVHQQRIVTDNMIVSVVKSCVRGSNMLKEGNDNRRAPLDAAAKVLESAEGWCDFPLVARHVNPLAAAYQSLGLLNEARSLLQVHLKDRSIGPEPENGQEQLNVHDVCAKDKGSYALLVKGAVACEEWADAVEALEDMTEAGLFPNQRNLNSWTEVSERRRKHRTTRSWKKKRNEYWLENVS